MLTSDALVAVYNATDGKTSWYEVECFSATTSATIVACSEAAVVIEIKTPTMSIHKVVAKVATKLLPSVLYACCIATVKNRFICGAVATAAETLISLQDNYSQSGSDTDGVLPITHVAKRGSSYQNTNSSLEFDTNCKETAIGIKTTLDEYKKNDYVKWGEVSGYSKEGETCSCNCNKG